MGIPELKGSFKSLCCLTVATCLCRRQTKAELKTGVSFEVFWIALTIFKCAFLGFKGFASLVCRTMNPAQVGIKFGD